MDNELLRKVQLCQLEIGKEIKRICEENNIKYFLDSGTLLGAVRHKGFIPWDDDMDIGMVRSEYEKFLKIAPEKLSSKFYLQTWNSDKNYPYAFAKVRKKNTLFIDAISQYSKTNNEIYVDILPYDNFPENLDMQRKQGKLIMNYKNIMLMKCKYTPWSKHKNIIEKILVYIKYIPYKIKKYFISREKLIEKYNKEMIKFNNIKTNKMYEQTGGAPYGKWVIPTQCLKELNYIQFEDDKFLASKDYDNYLKCVYGDYMNLPPIEKRGNWHQIIKVKL